jgi:hypothetical protein
MELSKNRGSWGKNEQGLDTVCKAVQDAARKIHWNDIYKVNNKFGVKILNCYL